MYPFFLQTLEKPKLYLQQWKHNHCDIFVNRRYVHGFKTIIFGCLLLWRMSRKIISALHFSRSLIVVAALPQKLAEISLLVLQKQFMWKERCTFISDVMRVHNRSGGMRDWAIWVQSSAFGVKVWQLWVSKKPVKFIHYHLCLMFVSFRHFYFRRLSRSLKSQRIEVTFIFEKKASIFRLERLKRVLFGLLVLF